MSVRRVVAAVLLFSTLLLAVVAVVLAFDNPEVDDTSRGDYSCLAPWDTALNGADNFPGGEPPADANLIATRCRSAGYERFGLAYISGVVAVGACALGITLSGTTYSRRRALVAVAAVASVTAAGWAGWERQHPTTFKDSGASVGFDSLPAGKTTYFGVNWPGNPRHDVVVEAAEARVHTDTTGADLAVVLCIPANDVDPIGTAFESSIEKYCSRLVPIGPAADTVLSARRNDQLLIRLSTARPGRVFIDGVDLHYRDGWREGHQAVIAEVSTTTPAP